MTRALMLRWLVLVTACACVSPSLGVETFPKPGGQIFSDAVAVWHMGTGGHVIGKRDKAVVHGAVQLGVVLSDQERKASLLRGGDGRVAEFNGGYLTVGQDVRLTGKEMTLLVRLRDADGKWDAPLLARRDVKEPLGGTLYGTGEKLAYRWRIDPPDAVANWKKADEQAKKGVLTIAAPAKMVGPKAWHDVTVRFDGPNLEMFVDGVLIDEEWPWGTVEQFSGPFLIGTDVEDGETNAAFRGQIDHVAVWDRALADKEIVALSGGPEVVAGRELDYLGPKADSPQYWRPRGYNTYAGDCMMLYDGKRVHLFYLFDRRHHTAKWRLGAHQYDHWSSEDLVHWTQHPRAIPLDYQWESSIGTGEFLYHDGVYYCSYTDCGSRCQFPDKPYLASGLFIASSLDGIHFVKHQGPVGLGSDSTLFRDERTGLFHLSASRLHYVSRDMKEWERQPSPFREQDNICPHWFHWNDWYYYIAGGKVHQSVEPLGPWTLQEPMFLEPKPTWCWPKTAAFKDDRRIAAAWIGDGLPLMPGYPKHIGWGGDIVLRELVQHEDGSLGTRFVPELIPASSDPIEDLAIETLSGTIERTDERIRLYSESKPAVGMLRGVPQNVRITMRVHPGPEAASFGVCVRGAGAYKDGVNYVFDPQTKSLRCGKPGGEEKYRLEQMGDLSKPFRLDIIATRNGLVDICIDDRRTLVTRRRDAQGDRLFLFANEGEVVFDSVEIRPLNE